MKKEIMFITESTNVTTKTPFDELISNVPKSKGC